MKKLQAPSSQRLQTPSSQGPRTPSLRGAVATKQSPRSSSILMGLLRFARNDRATVVASSDSDEAISPNLARMRGLLRFARNDNTLFYLFAILALSGCSLLHPPPRPSSIPNRLTAFPQGPAPVQAMVNIRWNKHHIPFIEASTDEDAAFALGLVHAHLRLGQMEILRRVAKGRISEMAGPWARDIDTALRILDLTAPSPRRSPTKCGH